MPQLRHGLKVPIKLERMFLRIRESYLDRGLSLKTATQRAAATVNKHRASLATGRSVCSIKRGKRKCKVRRGPKLVGRGGSRRQWWPGKKRARETFACLEHGRRFKTKAGLLSHYRRAH